RRRLREARRFRARADDVPRRPDARAGTEGRSEAADEDRGAREADCAEMRRQALGVRLQALGVLLLVCACRSTAPSANETPLTSGQSLDSLHSIGALMRVRVSNAQRTDSFRAQVIVEPATQRVELVAYTPVGTSGMTIFADHDHVVFLNHIDRLAWEGDA